jgi:uncharacterized repeat protein (TIGR01451 family)
MPKRKNVSLYNIKRIKRIKKGNKAVSELVGTFLLLGIAVTVFTSLFLSIMSSPPPNPPPLVEISGRFFENQIILTHEGGEPLDINTEIYLTTAEETEKMVIADYLDDESKENGFWDFSEEFVYLLTFEFDYVTYPDVGVYAVDKNSESIVFRGGDIEVHPICDLGIEITVDNPRPTINSYVTINVTITNHYNINAIGAILEFLLPDELIHYSNSTTQGTYINSTGIWDLGTIPPGESIKLTVRAQVKAISKSPEFTQLAVLLDGSGSIKAHNWKLCVEGLAWAMENGYNIPLNGTVELSVIQFGGKTPAYAVLEIGPIVINETNIGAIANDIRNIDQIGELTPTPCAILMAADTLANSELFTPDLRQIILLVTDGNPTHCCDCDGDYLDDQCAGDQGPKKDTAVTRDYLVNLLEMTEEQDEFNALAVEQSVGHADYLVDDVVWPIPGYYAPPYILDEYRGWVRNVTSWKDFAFAINESFAVIFNAIPVSGQLQTTVFIDPNEINDLATLVLKPLG